jgi:hypothetical protein
MPTITKSGSKITIGAMKHEGKSIIKKIFDLKGHEGERVRVHIDNDGKYTVESRPTQKLLVCELDVPTKKIISVDTGKKDEFEQPIMESKEQEVDLSKVEIKEYPKEVR